MFFYDRHCIQYLDLRDDFYHTKLKSLNFSIADFGHKAHLRSVRTGTNPNIIAIIVD